MNLTIIWLVLLIVLVVIELMTLGLTTIWFAGGALLATICAAVGAPTYLQIIVFFVTSILLLYFTRPIAIKYFNRDRIKTNAESIVGTKAIVTSEINNIMGAGQVTVSGQEWTARSVEDGCTIPVGAMVEVVAIHGVKLIVEEKHS